MWCVVLKMACRWRHEHFESLATGSRPFIVASLFPPVSPNAVRFFWVAARRKDTWSKLAVFVREFEPRNESFDETI